MGSFFSHAIILSALCLVLAPSLVAGALPEGFRRALADTGEREGRSAIVVDAQQQKLYLYEKGCIEAIYTVSTAARGLGSEADSWKTPLGLHRVSDKIGRTAPNYAIFRSRKFTGQCWHPESSAASDEDLILTRILRLEGLELGYNRGYSTRGRLVDSYDRYIYIHGTNHEKTLGTPCSQGCIRMSSTDIVDLFNRVPRGTLVWISPGAP